MPSWSAWSARSFAPTRVLYDTSKRQQVLDIMVKYTKEEAQVVADTYDELLKLKAWPQNDGIPQVNVEGTARSLKDSSQITTIPKLTDMVDLSIAKQVVQQLGSVRNFPY